MVAEAGTPTPHASAKIHSFESANNPAMAMQPAPASAVAQTAIDASMAAPAAPEQYDIAKSPEAPQATPPAAQPSTKATKRAADDMAAADPGLAIAADGNPSSCAAS